MMAGWSRLCRAEAAGGRAGSSGQRSESGPRAAAAGAGGSGSIRMRWGPQPSIMQGAGRAAAATCPAMALAAATGRVRSPTHHPTKPHQYIATVRSQLRQISMSTVAWGQLPSPKTPAVSCRGRQPTPLCRARNFVQRSPVHKRTQSFAGVRVQAREKGTAARSQPGGLVMMRASKRCLGVRSSLPTGSSQPAGQMQCTIL